MSKQLSYISIIYFLVRSFFIGITFSVLVKYSQQDAWISLLLAVFLGFSIIFLLEYIASYQPQKSLREKYLYLFPVGKYFFLFLTISIFLFLSVLGFWNLSNVITSQFLNKTPKMIISISFFIPLILLLSKNKKVINRVSLILFYISMVLFITSVFGLIGQFQISNFQPILTSSIARPIIPTLGFQLTPIFLLLIFPNDEIRSSLKKGYLLATFSLLIVTLMIIGVLGIHLATIYQYPEFHILKRAFQGVVTYRMENALVIQWIFDIFIFCTVSLKGCNDLMNWHQGWKQYLFPTIILLLSIFLFKDNTIANIFIDRYLSWILPSIMIAILLCFTTKIWYKKRRNSPILVKNNK